jgi:3'-phosphoadenosine 5'-phosphosulfate (PAPS) 3'-phosphatase
MPLYYIAAIGFGAYVPVLDPFTAVRVPQSPKKCQLVSPWVSKHETLKRILESINIEYRPIVLHSMVKAILLVEGSGDIYWRPACSEGEWAWDIAPISLIVEEAGGIATLGDGKPIRFAERGLVIGSDAGILFTNIDDTFHQRVLRGINLTNDDS